MVGVVFPGRIMGLKATGGINKCVVFVGGLPGSGKTTLVNQIAAFAEEIIDMDWTCEIWDEAGASTDFAPEFDGIRDQATQHKLSNFVHFSCNNILLVECTKLDSQIFHALSRYCLSLHLPFTVCIWNAKTKHRP